MINGLLLCRNNRETIYGLLGSHGDTENLVYLAEALQDTDRLIQYNLRYGAHMVLVSVVSYVLGSSSSICGFCSASYSTASGTVPCPNDTCLYVLLKLSHQMAMYCVYRYQCF
jgi:hypothetical protein